MSRQIDRYSSPELYQTHLQEKAEKREKREYDERSNREFRRTSNEEKKEKERRKKQMEYEEETDRRAGKCDCGSDSCSLCVVRNDLIFARTFPDVPCSRRKKGSKLDSTLGG